MNKQAQKQKELAKNKADIKDQEKILLQNEEKLRQATQAKLSKEQQLK